MHRAVIIAPLMDDEFNKREFSNREFLGAQYLVAALREKDIICDFVNAHAYRINNYDVCDLVLKEKYDFIGITCASQRGYLFSRELIRLLRSKGCHSHICLGGFFATIAFREILGDLIELDTILLGEADYTIYDLVSKVFKKNQYHDVKGLAYLHNNTIKCTEPMRVTNLDSLPNPIRDANLLGNISILGTNKITNGFFRVAAGRGCYGKCSFCTLMCFFHSNYKVYRTPENLVSELEMLIDTYGVRDFRFNDEIFYDLSREGQEWVLRFVETVKKRNLKIKFYIELRADDVREQEIIALKSIGLQRVSIGAESAVQRLLDEMNKGCTVEQIRDAIYTLRNNNVDTAVSFITIVPTMSFDELKMNYRFLFDTKIYNEENLYNKLNVYCGCEYVEILEKEQLLVKSTNFFERHNYLFKDFRVECFTRIIDKVRIVFARIKRNIFNLQSIEQESIIKRNNDYIRYSRELWKKIVLFMLHYIETKGNNLTEADLEENVMLFIKDDLEQFEIDVSGGA